jgi:hypothetical protein
MEEQEEGQIILEDKKEGQTILEDKKEGQIILEEKKDPELFVMHKNKPIYFNQGTLQLEFTDHELLNENKTTKYYGFNMLFKELSRNGNWEKNDEYLKLYYLKSFTPTDSMEIFYPLRDYCSTSSIIYGFVTIIDIKEDTNDFILYLKICNNENKFYQS